MGAENGGEITEHVDRLLSVIAAGEQAYPLDRDGRRRRRVFEQGWTRGWVLELGPRADAAVAELARRLRGSSPGERVRVARALGLVGGDDAVEPLVAALRDKEPIVRVSAAEALGALRDDRPTAIRGLKRALSDWNKRVAFEAALALSRIEPVPGAALPHLVEALDSSLSRERAAAALAALGPAARAAVPALLEAVFDEPDAALKAMLREACVKAGGPAVHGTVYGL